MRATLIAVVLWTIRAAYAPNVAAQDTDLSAPCAPHVPEEQRRAVTSFLGHEGIWFHLDVARCMLGRLTALPAYAQQVRLLEARLELGLDRERHIQRLRELAEEGERVAVDALEAAVRARREAEEARDAWYRHPAFWAALGAVLTVALEVVAVYLFRQL